MKTAQSNLNARTIRADRLQRAMPAMRTAGTAALFLVILTGALVAADTGLRIARDLPDLVAEAEARASW